MSLEFLSTYDALLLDLDGTVFTGQEPIPGAREGIGEQRRMFVTNNASRSPEKVAELLNGMGFTTSADEVLTSAQAACELAWKLVQGNQKAATTEAPVALVIGTASFKELAERRGFTVTESADEQPVVVLQGHSADTGWRQLSEAALAIRQGATFIASNLDTSLPSERGFLVGNGSMVAAVASATEAEPISAGKPAPTMFQVAQEKLNAKKPLVVGDRLDTDIAGGIAAEFDTLLVLTGVSTHWDVLQTQHRPTKIVANLNTAHPTWSATSDGKTVSVTSASLNDSEDYQPEVLAAAAVDAAAPAIWELLDSGAAITDISIVGTDSIATAAIQRWK